MFQAILPIRGKIINVEKARIDRVLKNNEVQSMITAFGTGIHDEFDLSKLRYHKIILMADADVDGQHIRTLLLTLLFRFMRPLVEAGYVYLAQPPLYKIKWGGKHGDEYVYTDREKDAVLSRGRRVRPQGQGRRHPALQGSRRDERHRAVGDHDEPGDPRSCCRSPWTTPRPPTSCSACSWARTSRPAAASSPATPRTSASSTCDPDSGAGVTPAPPDGPDDQRLCPPLCTDLWRPEP